MAWWCSSFLGQLHHELNACNYYCKGKHGLLTSGNVICTVFKMRLYIVGLCLAALAIAVSGGDDPTASLAGVTDLT